MRVKAGMKEAPGYAYRGHGLRHFKVARCGCARELQSLKINQERDPPEIEARKNSNRIAFPGYAAQRCKSVSRCAMH
jgi:hypothetical protein